MTEVLPGRPTAAKVIVLKPTAVRPESDQMLAPRTGTLNGRVVVLLGNVKANANEVLNQVERRLRERYEPAEIVRLGKPSASGSAERLLHPEEYQRLLSADIVITALGD